MTPNFTSQSTYKVGWPPMGECDLCDRLTLLVILLSRCFHKESFIVSHSLPTTWSVETVLSTDSQVVTPPAQGFPTPSILVCGHPVITLMSVSASHYSLYGALPRFLCLVRYDHSHGSKPTNSSKYLLFYRA